jgi:hypothetical protein
MKLVFSHDGVIVATRHVPGIFVTYDKLGDVELRNLKTKRLIARNHNQWWFVMGTRYSVSDLVVETEAGK